LAFGVQKVCLRTFLVLRLPQLLPHPDISSSGSTVSQRHRSLETLFYAQASSRAMSSLSRAPSPYVQYLHASLPKPQAASLLLNPKPDLPNRKVFMQRQETERRQTRIEDPSTCRQIQAITGIQLSTVVGYASARRSSRIGDRCRDTALLP
jgi:hypothetical protein